MPSVTRASNTNALTGKTCYVKSFKVHDIEPTGLFSVTLHILLETPLGNYRKTIHITEATIEAIATTIAEIVLAAIS